jgi:hypothetical protein
MRRRDFKDRKDRKEDNIIDFFVLFVIFDVFANLRVLQGRGEMSESLQFPPLEEFD